MFAKINGEIFIVQKIGPRTNQFKRVIIRKRKSLINPFCPEIEIVKEKPIQFGKEVEIKFYPENIVPISS